ARARRRRRERWRATPWGRPSSWAATRGNRGRPMRFLASGSIAMVLALLAARPAFPACGDRPGDAEAVAAVRAAAAAECDCAAAGTHVDYVHCVAAVATPIGR